MPCLRGRNPLPVASRRPCRPISAEPSESSSRMMFPGSAPVSPILTLDPAKPKRPFGPQLKRNGNLSSGHVSRCVPWLIGAQVSEMPPELPQTCRCLRQPPSAGLVAPQRSKRARRRRPPTLATADRMLAFMSDYDGTHGPEDSGIHH